MAEQERVMKRKGRRKKRKTSPRPSKTKGRIKRPGTAAAQKALWADPAHRAKMLEACKRGAAKRVAAGQKARLGVPDGMRKEKADKLREEAERAARDTMTELKKVGALDEGSDPRAEEALEAALVVMRSPGDKREKLAAARLILDFTRAKPASKSVVTVNAAEQWLAAIATETDDDEQSRTGEDETEAPN